MLVALLDELASPEQVAALMASVADLQDRLDQAFAELEEQSDALEARTVTHDGQAIYLTEDGSYRTVAGEIVDARDLPDDMPDSPATWAEYVALLERRAELSGIQTDVIDVIHERAAEGDMTAREVQEFDKAVDDAFEAIRDPNAVSAKSETTVLPPSQDHFFAGLQPSPVN